LNLVGHFYKIFIMMHGSRNVKFLQKTSANLYQTTRRHIPHDDNRHSHCLINRDSCISEVEFLRFTKTRDTLSLVGEIILDQILIKTE